MHRRRLPIARAALATLSAAALAPAQQSMTERMNADFERSPPLVGELLPDAAGHTAEGAQFRLSDTRGELTVLVFGCLT